MLEPFESMRAPETRAQFEALGTFPSGEGPEVLAERIWREMDKYAKVVQFAGMKVD